MDSYSKYSELTRKSLADCLINAEDIRWVIEGEDAELLPLLQAAYIVRHRYFGNGVRIHVLNNAQNGNCSEDCIYCSQSVYSGNKEEAYPVKSREEILLEAKEAAGSGAYRYCMVFSGSAPDDRLIEHITEVSAKIRELYNISVCVSAGFLTRRNASKLKASGVGRYNHNLNTSSSNYKNICTSHDYSRRVETVNTARDAGLEVCSGVIIGMGESIGDIVSMAGELRKVKANSVPVNFYIPGKNNRIPDMKKLTPEYCLRVLCAFRLTLPSCEIRIAAGREYHLRGMQSLSLYPANSLFANGYLTAGGDSMAETKKMIEDAGFFIDRFEG